MTNEELFKLIIQIAIADSKGIHLHLLKANHPKEYARLKYLIKKEERKNAVRQ